MRNPELFSVVFSMDATVWFLETVKLDQLKELDLK